MEELFISMGQGAAILFNPATLFITILYMIGGLLLGMFVGALPGLTTLTAMAILLPIVFFLEPIFGIPFLLASVSLGAAAGGVVAGLAVVGGLCGMAVSAGFWWIVFGGVARRSGGEIAAVFD